MTTFKAPVRDYNFSDALLIEICLEKIAFAQRDATEMASVGIDATWVSDFNERVLAFGAMPTDVIELGEQEEATAEKETDVNQLLDKLKELRSAAKRALGEKSVEYGAFGFKDLDKFKDADLLKLALVLPALTTKHAAALATKGWIAADNAALQGMLNTLVSGLQNQKIEVGSRDSATESRILEGNEIYNLLSNELCEAGKAYWRTLSEAKYNDYEIYDTAPGGGGGGVTFPVFFEGDLVIGNISSFEMMNLDIEAHPNLNFIFENLSTSQHRYYAAAAPADAPGAGAVLDVFPNNAVPKTIQQLITELGFNETRHYLNILNVGPAPAHFKVIIEE